MLKFCLILSGVLSFLFFVSPKSFNFLAKSGDVLGVHTTTQTANRQTVYEGLLSYCLDKGKLPTDLNELYQAELSTTAKIDLNAYFKLKVLDSRSCEFELKDS